MDSLKIRIFWDVLSAFRQGYNTQYAYWNVPWISLWLVVYCSWTYLRHLTVFPMIWLRNCRQMVWNKIYSLLQVIKKKKTMCEHPRKHKCVAISYLNKRVPQGSILGPSMFSFFLSDFCWIFEELLAMSKITERRCYSPM